MGLWTCHCRSGPCTLVLRRDGQDALGEEGSLSPQPVTATAHQVLTDVPWWHMEAVLQWHLGFVVFPEDQNTFRSSLVIEERGAGTGAESASRTAPDLAAPRPHTEHPSFLQKLSRTRQFMTAYCVQMLSSGPPCANAFPAHKCVR